MMTVIMRMVLRMDCCRGHDNQLSATTPEIEEGNLPREMVSKQEKRMSRCQQVTTEWQVPEG